MVNGIEISTDKELLDIDFISSYLKESYWANKRSKEAIEKSIQNSLCFGLYKDRIQIGFARVITDHTVFAYLMDVFVVKDFENQGLGSLLMDTILNHESIKEVEKFKLATQDAHEFYKKKGFESIKNPEFQMEKCKSDQ